MPQDASSLLESRANELAARFYCAVIFGKYLLYSHLLWALSAAGGFWLLLDDWKLLGSILIIPFPIAAGSFLRTRGLKGFALKSKEAINGFKNLFSPSERESLKPLLNQLEDYLFNPNPRTARMLKEIAEETERRFRKVSSWTLYRDIISYLSFLRF